MTEKSTALRKHLSIGQLTERRQEIEDPDYWRGVNPGSSISEVPLRDLQGYGEVAAQEVDRYEDQLREDRYFQTDPVIPEAMRQEMLGCIESVRKAGLPVMYALVYDVFYRAFYYFDTALAHVLGPEYKLIPNFWVYYIEPSDGGKGFEPHRDAEYADTIGADGLPTVLTLWVAVTDATPLNSCMYVLPATRDPQYAQAIHDLDTGATGFALEDVRALPARAGTLSCWDQYIFHWGRHTAGRRHLYRSMGQDRLQDPVGPDLEGTVSILPAERSTDGVVSISSIFPGRAHGRASRRFVGSSSSPTSSPTPRRAPRTSPISSTVRSTRETWCCECLHPGMNPNVALDPCFSGGFSRLRPLIARGFIPG
jgi:hypothetical protein